MSSRQDDAPKMVKEVFVKWKMLLTPANLVQVQPDRRLVALLANRTQHPLTRIVVPTNVSEARELPSDRGKASLPSKLYRVCTTTCRKTKPISSKTKSPLELQLGGEGGRRRSCHEKGVTGFIFGKPRQSSILCRYYC